MADATIANSLYAVRMRVARLGADGAPLVGADNLYVTDALVRFDYEPTYEDGETVQKRNGRGRLCLNVKGDDELSGLDVTLEICNDDPMLSELLSGGSVLTTGGGADVVGYQLPKSSDPAVDGVSIEIWTEAYSGSERAGDFPWFWYAFPKVKLRPGSRSLSAESDEKVFTGSASENSAWDNGPANDWTHDSSAAGQWVRTATTPPTPTGGYAATVAHVATP